MPEYLAPGVYVEETSFRSKSIEGVSTSTAGFVGPARWGPVSGDPELLTSLADFERIYGGIEDLEFSGQMIPNYLAHGVRAFFEEGGERLYVSRVFNFGDSGFAVNGDGIPTDHYASLRNIDNVALDIGGSPPQGLHPMWVVTRFPGKAGNMRVTFTLRVGANAFTNSPKPGTSPSSTHAADKLFRLTQVQGFSVVHIGSPVMGARSRITGWNSYPPGSPPTSDGLFLAYWDAELQRWEFKDGQGTSLLFADLYGADPSIQVRPVTVLVEAAYPTVNAQGVEGFGVPILLGEFGFDSRSANGLTKTFTRNPITRLQSLTIPFSVERQGGFGGDADLLPLSIARDLLGSHVIGSLISNNNQPEDTRVSYTLSGGDDGILPVEANYEGNEFAFQDFSGDPLQEAKNGLLAFEAVEGISIVAAPGYSANPTADDVFAVHRAVINHCEKMRYRVAVLDTPPNQLVSQALDSRNMTSSNYAALYYPWITIANPLRDERLDLPPSGFVAGIYARNDTEHAVFKAPANEVVRLAIDFEQRLNKAQQDVLNPAGVNCFRFFPGHGFLLWGARTISDDPEWKYISVRRYFAYLEHSIDRGTQWVVFENNSKQLWDNVRHTIEDFLLNEWKMGALMGDKPEQAYFVRCDLSTMTQNDLDNGRLVCLIGVAVVKPAEFVIFRIGQWTSDRKF
jgi:phage tail sheath protein FI